ncbi:hypothetical protein GCM10009844_01920 [Nocardioides koreensis]|uniref:Lipoprotein n=1 Tax=Nocardioides koreensis TaxID=433651 RepID=A0ABN2Z364_9ACTN
MIKRIVLGTLAAAVLTACGGTDSDKVDSQTSTAAACEESSPEATSSSQGTILESGFGQSNEYAWVTALVQNDSDHAGQTVTVNFNVKDASGKLAASGSQVSAFYWAGQKLPVGTQVDLGRGVKAASMEATVLVEDEGTFDDQVVEQDWGSFPGTIYKQYGNWGAKFQVENPTSEPLDGSAVAVICHNASGEVIGGSSTYPDLIPPSGETLVDVSDLYAAAEPHDCVGYLHPWM